MLAALESISRGRPDRVLRLRGTLPAADDGASEAFELLIFRGVSSSVTHPTAFDPDQPALPEGAEISGAELLEAPLRSGAERILAGPMAAGPFLDPAAWV
ncbi:hypothetical protein [Cyanobium sp. Morenito 9A2]|uniref:DUF7734 family protein n=1 Tax=Cyanobium sp. Morenito 9A2 TaxID=2823718 RepID=UPI0020CDA5D7|nr:hypothetical protein [Cyanobium sp. Morenito 9A2]MCP9849665.1 hypothetical protein [Cyanobium sp. Morenito 9A2]